MVELSDSLQRIYLQRLKVRTGIYIQYAIYLLTFLQVLKHVTFSDTIFAQFYNSPYTVSHQCSRKKALQGTTEQDRKGMLDTIKCCETLLPCFQLIVSNFHDYWSYDNKKGVANSKVIFHWLNIMHVRAKQTKWNKSCRQWHYVQWKINIIDSEAKLWIPKDLLLTTIHN